MNKVRCHFSASLEHARVIKKDEAMNMLIMPKPSFGGNIAPVNCRIGY